MANPDLIVALRLVRMSNDPQALASAILRALPPWPLALAAARAIVEREADRAEHARLLSTPFGALAIVARRASHQTTPAAITSAADVTVPTSELHRPPQPASELGRGAILIPPRRTAVADEAPSAERAPRVARQELGIGQLVAGSLAGSPEGIEP